MRDTESDISFFFFLSRINWKNDWKLLYRSFFFPYKKILFFLSKYRITGCVNRIVRKEYYIWYLTADNDEGHCTRTETAHQRFLLFIRDNTTGGRTVRHLQGTKSSSNWLFFFFSTRGQFIKLWRRVSFYTRLLYRVTVVSLPTFTIFL